MSEEKDKSKIPKPLTPVEYVKDIQAEVSVLSKELHAISHLPKETKEVLVNAAELIRGRIRALHMRECEILSKKS